MRNVLLALTMLFALNTFAQSTHTIDFEPGGTGADWNWVVVENADNPPLEFVANPDNAGINPSATAAKFTARAGGQPWALCFTDGDGEFTFDATNSIVKIMVNKPVISNVGVKFEGFSGAIEILLPNTLINQWEELTFDFSEKIGSTYSTIVIIPDFLARAEDHIIYFDNLQVPDGVIVPPPAEPTAVPPIPPHAEEDVISIYSDAFANVPGTDFNPNWGQSTQVTVDYVAAGNNTLRYMNLNYQGTQFGINQDVSGYEYLHVDFWTPNSTLLRFFLISPGAETFYTLPITAETWVSVDIPLTHFVPPVNLADVFQFKVDGNGTVFFDNWYFWKTPFVAGTDATLSDLRVDGTTVDGFSPAVLSYNVVLPEGTTEVPVVTATPNDPEASHVVNAAAGLPGTTEVVVTAADGTTVKTYTVEFTVAGPVPASEYCETEVFHFGNPAELPSAIYLTIKNFDALSMIVEIESATDDPVDLLIVTGGSGAAISGENTSVPGKISRMLSWVSDPPADVTMNILWSKESFPGNWMLIEGEFTVPFAAVCEPAGPAAITFRVDMSEYSGEFTNVYVSGSFNGWSGDANQLLDMDMDGVYEADLLLENGNYEYKFTLDGWAVQEEFIGGEPCVITMDGYHNRALTVTGPAVLPAVCWNSCYECDYDPGIYDVTFSVDMNEFGGSYGGVFLNGNFNGWCGDCTQMFDPEMDGIYEVTIQLTPGNYEYKFTLDGWSQQEMFAEGEPCTVTNFGFTNRFVEIVETTFIPTVCWNSCYACGQGPQPKNVTFSVDMSDYEGSYTNVYVSGSFNGWCGDCNLMTETDLPNVYETTIILNDGTYEYKFTLDNWAGQEALTPGDPCTITTDIFTNRLLIVDQDVALLTVCWESCDVCPDYKAGWHGISGNVIPENAALEDVFAPILEDMVILLGKDGIFWPSQNINTLGDWDTYQGYKVKFNTPVHFQFSGAPLTDRTVTFDPGLYYVPVLSEGPVAVADVIVPLGEAVDLMYDLTNALIYWPTGGVVPGVPSSLETLCPGFAYLAKFSQTVTIDFGAAPVKSSAMPVKSSKPLNITGWNDAETTGSQHIFSIVTDQLKAGDYVGVFDAAGTSVGLAQYNGNAQVLALVAAGNDITTQEKDGLVEGETMAFRIFRDGSEIEVSAVYDKSLAHHDGKFAESGLSIIREFKMGATMIDDVNAVSFSVYPNPGSGLFTLTPIAEDNFDVMVTNVQGQQVYAGKINGTATINLNGQAKGIYFVRLSNAANTLVKKIVIE
jgi:hypothetical protein